MGQVYKNKIIPNTNENMLFTLLKGAAIGAGIRILYPPDKGTKTRKKIKQKAEDAKHSISERISHAKAELTTTVNKKKEEFEQKLDNTISNMSSKNEDIIASLENKLVELKKKNKQAKS